jgi:replication factor C small subunit
MLWTERYRPTSLEEIIGHEKFRADAQSWIDNLEMPNLLLYGPAGTGKTTVGGVLGNELLGNDKQSNFEEINASDDRRLETIRTKVKTVARQRKMGDVPFKIILLDEMDGMTFDAQNALKRIMERYSGNVRFIITANNRSRIITPLQSRCADYFFRKLSDEEIKSALSNILRRENKEIPSDIDIFISLHNGDLRKAITNLQAAINSGNTLKFQATQTLKIYEEVLESLVEGKRNEAYALLMKEVDAGKTIQSICFALHEIVNESELDSNLKYKILGVVGEAEWRSRNMTPKILISWLIAQIKTR